MTGSQTAVKMVKMVKTALNEGGQNVFFGRDAFGHTAVVKAVTPQGVKAAIP